MRNDVQICASYWKLVMLLQASINGPQRIASLGSVDLSCAPLAQSAERFHGKEKVVGSIPTGGSHCAGGAIVRLAEHAGVAQLVRAHDS